MKIILLYHDLYFCVIKYKRSVHIVWYVWYVQSVADGGDLTGLAVVADGCSCGYGLKVYICIYNMLTFSVWK